MRDLFTILLAKIFEVKSFYIIAFQYLCQYLFVCTFFILARGRVNNIGNNGNRKIRISDTDMENYKNFFAQKSWQGSFTLQTLMQSQKSILARAWQNLGNLGKFFPKTRKLRTFPVSDSILTSKNHVFNI